MVDIAKPCIRSLKSEILIRTVRKRVGDWLKSDIKKALNMLVLKLKSFLLFPHWSSSSTANKLKWEKKSFQHCKSMFRLESSFVWLSRRSLFCYLQTFYNFPFCSLVSISWSGKRAALCGRRSRLTMNEISANKSLQFRARACQPSTKRSQAQEHGKSFYQISSSKQTQREFDLPSNARYGKCFFDSNAIVLVWMLLR